MPYTAPPAANLGHRWKFDTHAGADGVGIQTLAPLAGAGNLTQATAANQPTLVYNAVNGKKAARWLDAAGGTQFMTASTGTAPAQPVTYVTVLRPGSTIPTATGSANYCQVFAWGHELHTDAGKWRLWAGTGFTAASLITLDAWQVEMEVVNGSTSTIYVNGTLLATGNAGTGAAGTTLTLGRYSSAARWWRGDIAEVMRYTGALDGSTRALVDSYVQDEYGIAVSDYVSSGTAYTAEAFLPVSAGLVSLSTAAAVVRGSLGASAGLNAPTAAARAGSGVLPAAVGLAGSGTVDAQGSGVLPAAAGLTGRASVGMPASGSLPAAAGISSSSSTSAAVSGPLPTSAGLEATTELDAAAIARLGATVDLAGAGTVVGASIGELRATVTVYGASGVSASASGVLPIVVRFSGIVETVGPVEYTAVGTLPISTGFTSATSAAAQAAGTLGVTAGAASSTAVSADAFGVLPVSIAMLSDAIAQLEAVGTLPVTVDIVAVEQLAEQRDITVSVRLSQRELEVLLAGSPVVVDVDGRQLRVLPVRGEREGPNIEGSPVRVSRVRS